MNTNLTLTQQFELKRIRDAAPGLKREQKIKLLVQAQRLKYFKENFLKNGYKIVSAMDLPMEQLFTLAAMEERIQKNTNEELTDMLIQYIEDLMALDGRLREELKLELIGD